MSLVRATRCHGPLLAAIHAEAFPPREQWGADAMALQLGLLGAAGWLAGDAGFVLFRVAADEAEILTLAVRPGCRRRGIGRALLEAALASAREAGATAMFLEVAADNEAAAALYATAGFGEVGRRRRYYPGGGDARVLRAALDEAG